MNNIRSCEPFVSIVVITRDRHDLLIKAVNSLQELAYPKDRREIIVVEEGDSPMQVSNVNYIFLPRRDLGLGYARNIGVKSAKGDIVAFTDDDCIADRLWLSELIAVFNDPAVGGAAGSTFAQQGNLIGQCEDMLGFPGGGHKRHYLAKGKIVETDLLSGCNCAYRKDVFKKWLFKEDGYGRLGADDLLMGQNVSERYKCLYVPQAVIFHKPRGSLGRIVSWFARRKINELLYREMPEGRKNYFSLFMLPHKFVLLRIMMLLIIIFFLGWKGVVVIFAMGLLGYIFLVLRHLPVAVYSGMTKAVFLVPIVKAFMDLGVMVGEWKYLAQSHEQLGLALNEYNR